MSLVSFGAPTYLWLLVLVPVLALFLFWAVRAQRRALERFAVAPLLAGLTRSINPARRLWRAFCLVTAVLFLVLALAQPRWGFEWREVKRRGADLFVLLDVSKSMLAEDVRPNRLTQAKFGIEDLLGRLQGDRIGLIAFAGTAFVQCPLTIDYEAFRLTLREAGPELLPRGGTALALAVRTALKSFEAGEGRDRAIVLVTDGEENQEEVRAAAAEAARAGVRVYAIGVGTLEGELIPVRVAGQPPAWLKDQQGQVVKTRLQEEPLRQLALATQGIYVRSAAGDFGLEPIFEKGIRQLQRGEFEAQLQKRYFERFQWPVALALFLLLLESLVTERKRS